MSQAKGLAPLGRLLQNLTNHLCLLHDCLFLCDCSFNFVFSWHSTVPLDIPVPNSNFFFLKAFVPLCCLLSRSYLNICEDCILFISAGSASANRKGAWFCSILRGSIIGGLNCYITGDVYIGKSSYKAGFGAFSFPSLIISGANFDWLLMLKLLTECEHLLTKKAKLQSMTIKVLTTGP